jgi:cell division protease FtsH
MAKDKQPKPSNKVRLPMGSQMRQTPKKKVEFQFKINLRRLLIWFLLFLLFVPYLIQLLSNFTGEDQLTLTQLVNDIKQEKIEKIEVLGDRLQIFYKGSDTPAIAYKESSESLVATLKTADIDPSLVNIEIVDQSASKAFFDAILTFLPLILMGLFFFILIRQARGAQDGIMGFGRSKAKLFSKGKQDVTFNDVGGVKEAKQELEEVVDFLKHPKKYRKLGARTPKGVLLVGPSGTGKTLLARAVAGEANAPFFSMAGSEFMEMLVGVGASRVRDLFDTAKKASPAIIFIDEIDAIGRTRGLGSMGGHDEREQTLNQILVEMDGFTQSDNVIVLAATNRGDLLDQALTRPGRFDRTVMVGLPDIEERKKILKIHAKGKPFATSVNWDRAAKRTVGFSGADLENMLNEAAIQAARESKKSITWEHLEESATKVKLGPQKKRLQSEYEKKMTAYHEAGHAVVSHYLPHADPVHRVSIVSRGMALGFTLTPPEEDKYQQTRSELIEQIAVLLGGRTAEQLAFNELTGGASNDIDKATRIARAMVVDYGMDEDLGPINFGPQHDTSFGKIITEPVKVSDSVQAKVDAAIKRIFDGSQKLAVDILTKHRKKLDIIAEELIKKETLDGDDFEKLLGVKKARIDSGKKS